MCLQRCNVHTLLGRLDPNGPELDDPFEADEESDTPSVADELGALLGAGCECAAGRGRCLRLLRECMYCMTLPTFHVT